MLINIATLIVLLILLMIGFCIVILTSYVNSKLFYHNTPKYPKLNRITIFVWYLSGIIYILGIITGYILIAILLPVIIAAISELFLKYPSLELHIKIYPSLELNIKERNPEMYEKTNIWTIKRIIILISAIFLLVNYLKFYL